MSSSVPLSVCQNRRQALFEKMSYASIAIVTSGNPVAKSEDMHYPFIPNCYFYYLTGVEEPGAIAVFIKDADGGQQFIMLMEPNDPGIAQWEGDRIGVEGVKTLYGADQAYAVADFANCLPYWLDARDTIYTLWPMPQTLRDLIDQTLVWLKNKSRAGWQPPYNSYNLCHIVDEMRLIKDEHEVRCTRQAVEASVKGHKAIMHNCQAGVTEYQLRAQFMQAILWHGCQEEAYPSIVAAGGNACVLHYDQCQDTAQQNQLLLTDAGGRYQYYCADITRTIPVDGQFNPYQRTIYELVLSVQQAVINEVKPGAVWRDLHQLSVRLIVDGLIELGLLQGDRQQIIDNGDYKTFYMHYIGHWLGLDTHDVGLYKRGSKWRELESGMLLTIEPGIYIKPDDAIDPQWWHIGVRIEDNILVTDDGCEVLSKDLPKQPEEIEGLMLGAHHD